MDVEVIVDRERCIGSGQCVHLAPATFDQDDQALAFVVDPPGQADDRTLRAITGCPMQAIALQIDGVAVSADDLRNWVNGLRSDDPLVEAIGSLSESHHELREAATEAESGSVTHLVALARAHLAEEDRTYEAITALVSPALIRAFETDRDRIRTCLESTSRSSSASRARETASLIAALEEHIRLEEAVLFPLALASLGREHLRARS